MEIDYMLTKLKDDVNWDFAFLYIEGIPPLMVERGDKTYIVHENCLIVGLPPMPSPLDQSKTVEVTVTLRRQEVKRIEFFKNKAIITGNSGGKLAKL